MHKSRWGFHPCSFAEFRELRDLWRAVLFRRRQAAAWHRWNAKAPQNRVKRERIRDPAGRVIGYGPPIPMPEPPLAVVDVERIGPNGEALRRLQEAYRLARRPRPTAAEVEALPVTLAEVSAWKAAIGG